jgi:hypothetical protein
MAVVSDTVVCRSDEVNAETALEGLTPMTEEITKVQTIRLTIATTGKINIFGIFRITTRTSKSNCRAVGR